MRTILVLLRKDLVVFFNLKAAVCLTFLVPIALIYIFGQVFGVNRKDSGPVGIALAVVNQSDQAAAPKLIQALAAEKSFRVLTNFQNPDRTWRPLVEADLRPMMRENRFRFAVVIPKDLIAEKGLGLHLKILSDPRNEIESQMVHGILQKTILTSVPQLVGASLVSRAQDLLGPERFDLFNGSISRVISATFGGEPQTIARSIGSGDFGLSRSLSSTNATNFLARVFNLEREQVVGKNVKNPEATRVVGGWAMMFLLFALSAAAAAFFSEKESGVLQRLLAAPVRPSHILWSRFLFGVIIGLLQLTALFCAGWAMFDIDVFGHFINLVVICTAAAAACTAFGMLIAAFTKSPQAANGLATFLVLTMSATGGAWFPISLMPEFMQRLAHFTLVYWAMEGFSQVLWAGNSFRQILPIVGVLLGITGGVMAVALWQINRSRILE